MGLVKCVFMEGVYCGAEIEVNKKKHRSQVNLAHNITNERVKKIFDVVAPKINEARPNFLRNLEAERLKELDGANGKNKKRKFEELLEDNDDKKDDEEIQSKRQKTNDSKTNEK